MRYNVKKFVEVELNFILTMAALVGICYLFGWSTAFLFLGLGLASACIALPLKLIIRHFFQERNAIILECILAVALGCVIAQQLFLAECMKLYMFSGVFTAFSAISLMGMIFSDEMRDNTIKEMYGDYSLPAEASASGLSAIPVPSLSRNPDLSSFSEEVQPPPYRSTPAFTNFGNAVPAANDNNNLGIPPDLGDRILAMHTQQPAPKRRTAAPS